MTITSLPASTGTKHIDHQKPPRKTGIAFWFLSAFAIELIAVAVLAVLR